jgi:pimeloyl-ACP methyl ester carboxylesterase
MNGHTYEGQYANHYFDLGSLRLHYTEWNPAGSPAVVLLHGLNVQLHTWDPIAARLSQNYRVICPDLRGHGESAWAPDGYGIESFVGDLHALASQLGIAPFILVGHSLGARIAIAFAGEHPEMLTHLLLSDTGPEMPKATAANTSDFIGDTNAMRAFRDPAEALAHYKQVHSEWKPEFLDLHARHQVRRNWAGKYVLRADPDLFWLTKGAGAKEIPYMWEAARKADMPTLIMYGKRSKFFDRTILDRMLSTMSQAEEAVFDAGHYIPREDPDAFYDAVIGFITRKRPG